MYEPLIKYLGRELQGRRLLLVSTFVYNDPKLSCQCFPNILDVDWSPRCSAAGRELVASVKLKSVVCL